MTQLELFAIGAAFVLFFALATYPWLLALIVPVVGAWVYWRWVRPRRRARSEAAWQEQERQEAERAEHDRQVAHHEELRVRSLNLGGLLTLTAREFELRVAGILAGHGYEGIEHVGRSGDLGIDLFATNPEGQRVGVQCKRYAPDKLVRAPEVRLLYGDMTHANVGGVFVTTSSYTADAAAYAEGHGIRLIDGQRLTRLLAATLSEPS
jgi:restriction endonuclease Mrr